MGHKKGNIREGFPCIPVLWKDGREERECERRKCAARSSLAIQTRHGTKLRKTDVEKGETALERVEQTGH